MLRRAYVAFDKPHELHASRQPLSLPSHHSGRARNRREAPPRSARVGSTGLLASLSTRGEDLVRGAPGACICRGNSEKMAPRSCNTCGEARASGDFPLLRARASHRSPPRAAGRLTSNFPQAPPQPHRCRPGRLLEACGTSVSTARKGVAMRMKPNTQLKLEHSTKALLDEFSHLSRDEVVHEIEAVTET